MAIRFKGNCPRNVNRDAKYTIRIRDGRPVVSIVYITRDGERWYPTTDEHSELIYMIRQVRSEFGQEPYGSFYINEYKQVILPILGQRDYYYAGEYTEPLVFEFEGLNISGNPQNFIGEPLNTGDEWVGPHQGIPYVLTAGGNDIRYEVELRRDVFRNVRLSEIVDKENVRYMANRIREIIGPRGGRFYVNEFGAIFTPRYDGLSIRYTYICQLDYSAWFPKPQLREIEGESLII